MSGLLPSNQLHALMMTYATMLQSVLWLTHLILLGISLSHGGLGLRCLSLHSPAAYIPSVIASDYSSPHSKHLLHSVELFN